MGHTQGRGDFSGMQRQLNWGLSSPHPCALQLSLVLCAHTPLSMFQLPLSSVFCHLPFPAG